MSDDDFWGNNNPGDVSIDTGNSKEMMTGSHITELHNECEELVPPESLNAVLNESRTPKRRVGVFKICASLPEQETRKLAHNVQ